MNAQVDAEVNPEHQQLGHRVRFDWGPTGAAAVVAGADVAVVVDVLSFTTTVTVGVARGIEVLPYLWKDDRAAAYAEERGASLATRPGARALAARDVAARGRLADRRTVPERLGDLLRPRRLRRARPRRVACATAPRSRPPWPRAPSPSWPAASAGRTARCAPCAEDLWGAGAVLALLPAADLSPEARLAADAYRAVAGSLAEALHACAGGRELHASGFGADVDVAAGLDADDVVPVLDGDTFRAAPG